MSDDKSHLELESPEFEGVPHLWVQWKGTDVCCDVHCICGAHMHFDGDFFYFFQCPHCKRYWECGTHVKLYEVTEERAKAGCFAGTLEPDDDDFDAPASDIRLPDGD